VNKEKSIKSKPQNAISSEQEFHCSLFDHSFYIIAYMIIHLNY